ncbi:tetratricopeptide repeat protein [Flavobacteriales bacterium]|nr:tetratricopeptide repeat protein [Flavobacteriales bacterium]
MENHKNKLVSLALLALLILPLTYMVKQRIDLANEQIKSSQNQKKEASVSAKPQANKDVAIRLLEQGLHHYQSKNYKKSIELTKKSLALDPTNATAFNNLCAAYNELGMWEQAIEACEHALEINSEMKIAKNNLDWAKKNQ